MNGDVQDLDAHTRFLMTVHAQHPGLTERSIGAARTADGLTSYEAFCRFVDPQPGMTVVDLACGSGPLCGMLAERVGASGRVIGVDLSGDELLLAGERLRSYSNVRLKKESAAKLSLPDGSTDLVVCHMAFMLFTPLALTVGEIGRVLKPSGIFAAVVPTLRKPTELFRNSAVALRTALQAERHALDALSGNAVSMNSAADLERIFADSAWRSEEIVTRDIDLSVSADAATLVERVAPAFYHYQLLSSEGKRLVDAERKRLFEKSRNASGEARFDFPLSAFSVRRGR
jgi:SAM-dependent methyltransferase